MAQVTIYVNNNLEAQIKEFVKISLYFWSYRCKRKTFDTLKQHSNFNLDTIYNFFATPNLCYSKMF